MPDSLPAPPPDRDDEPIWIKDEMVLGAFGAVTPALRRRFNRMLYSALPEDRPPVFRIDGVGNCMRPAA
jgi:hypothetical protein